MQDCLLTMPGLGSLTRLQYRFDAVLISHASPAAFISHRLEVPKARIAVPHTPGPGSGSRTLVIIVDPDGSDTRAVRLAEEKPREITEENARTNTAPVSKTCRDSVVQMSGGGTVTRDSVS